MIASEKPVMSKWHSHIVGKFNTKDLYSLSIIDIFKWEGLMSMHF